MSNRNRDAGHALERDRAEQWRAIGYPHVVTSRSENKKRDDSGIDLMNTEEAVNGFFDYAEQDKCTSRAVLYPKLLREAREKAEELMPKAKKYIMPLVVHRRTEGQDQANGKRVFKVTGEYAILYLEDFMQLAAIRKRYDEDQLKLGELQSRINELETENKKLQDTLDGISFSM